MDRTLYEAAKSGNVQVINEFFGGFQRVTNEVTPGGYTVLHIAAYHGSLRFVQELVRLSNADPEDGMTFLKAKNMLGNTALHEAALGGNKQVVNALLQSCPDLVDEINVEGETALFKACEGGHANIVEELCSQTSREYNKRFDGQTPLHLAVSKLNIDLIKVLLEHKRELATEVDNFNRTPLHMAALYQLPVAILSVLSKKHEKISVIGEMLIKSDGLSCYKVDRNKQSALHVAVKEGNADLVKVILKQSSDCLEMVDKDGRNALHLAVNNAVEIFDKAGGNGLKAIIFSVTSERLINCIDDYGQTALDIALKKGNEDPQLYRGIIRYLDTCGAVKKIFDTDSTTILSRAAKSWNPELISVSAVLIATVAFAAVFTLPGGIDTQGQGSPILINTLLFKLFVIFDTLALCYSIASAILLVFAFHATILEDPIITDLSLHALWVALLSLSLTFGAAIHLVVAPKCLWLSVFVWVNVCLLPICIRAMSLSGKVFLLTPRDQHINFLLRSFFMAVNVFEPFAAVSRVVFFSILHPSLCRVWKKLH